jgi:hypothetical protein
MLTVSLPKHEVVRVSELDKLERIPLLSVEAVGSDPVERTAALRGQRTADRPETEPTR